MRLIFLFCSFDIYINLVFAPNHSSCFSHHLSNLYISVYCLGFREVEDYLEADQEFLQRHLEMIWEMF